MRNAFKIFSVAAISFALMACETLGIGEMGETTKVATATGGAIGAGLGAIVGSQTGSAGTGLVVGGLVGAGTGAAVGNQLENQQAAIKTQDQAIERQEQTLRAQRTEIESLKGATRDSVSFRDKPAGSSFESDSRARMGALNNSNSFKPEANSAGRGSFNESNLIEPSLPRGSAPALSTSPRNTLDTSATRGDSLPSNTAPVRAASAFNSADSGSPECLQAETEVSSAAGSVENADKLFHLRRALRLCPTNANYHNNLGEVYGAMNRKADAEFEYKEALRLNPQLEAASRNLADLGARR